MDFAEAGSVGSARSTSGRASQSLDAGTFMRFGNLPLRPGNRWALLGLLDLLRIRFLDLRQLLLGVEKDHSPRSLGR
jgi:hypothetical protein